MENSVEIMCIDICLNSSPINYKRMGRKEKSIIVSPFKRVLLTPAPERLVFVGCHDQSTPSEGLLSKISKK